jgi:hypothetical protein
MPGEASNKRMKLPSGLASLGECGGRSSACAFARRALAA